MRKALLDLARLARPVQPERSAPQGQRGPLLFLIDVTHPVLLPPAVAPVSPERRSSHLPASPPAEIPRAARGRAAAGNTAAPVRPRRKPPDPGRRRRPIRSPPVPPPTPL